MQIDSVRELKQSLTNSVLAPLAASVTARRTLHVAAQPAARAAGTHRTIALGIARAGEHDYRLAVRVARRAMEGSAQLDLIRTPAKGECEVRYVGRVMRSVSLDEARAVKAKVEEIFSSSCLGGFVGDGNRTPSQPCRSSSGSI